MKKEEIVKLINDKIEELEKKKAELDKEISESIKFICYDSLVEEGRDAYALDEEINMLNDILNEIGE